MRCNSITLCSRENNVLQLASLSPVQLPRTAEAPNTDDRNTSSESFVRRECQPSIPIYPLPSLFNLARGWERFGRRRRRSTSLLGGPIFFFSLPVHRRLLVKSTNLSDDCVTNYNSLHDAAQRISQRANCGNDGKGERFINRTLIRRQGAGLSEVFCIAPSHIDRSDQILPSAEFRGRWTNGLRGK